MHVIVKMVNRIASSPNNALRVLQYAAICHSRGLTGQKGRRNIPKKRNSLIMEIKKRIKQYVKRTDGTTN